MTEDEFKNGKPLPAVTPNYPRTISIIYDNEKQILTIDERISRDDLIQVAHNILRIAGKIPADTSMTGDF